LKYIDRSTIYRFCELRIAYNVHVRIVVDVELKLYNVGYSFTDEADVNLTASFLFMKSNNEKHKKLR